VPLSLLWRCAACVPSPRNAGPCSGHCDSHDSCGFAGGVCSQGAAAEGVSCAVDAGCSQHHCGVWRSFVCTAPAGCVVLGCRRGGVSLWCVQPELKAVLQPYGADRVSACGARAAVVVSGAWLVGWCSARAAARALAAARCGRERLGASAGAHPSGHRGNAGAPARLVEIVWVALPLSWVGRGASGRDDAVQALLQSNARADAADSNGCDPARGLSPSACSVEHSRRADRMIRRASGLGAETAVQYGCHSMERVGSSANVMQGISRCFVCGLYRLGDSCTRRQRLCG
jgi:hypothetical protein